MTEPAGTDAGGSDVPTHLLAGLPRSRHAAGTAVDVPPIDRRHLHAISDQIGIWQFAVGTTPHRSFGYCSDDVARDLVVQVLHGRWLGWAAVAPSIERDLVFLAEAFDLRRLRFRNMRDANGEWKPGWDSDDCHARSLLGLGTLMAWSPDPPVTAEASTLFFRALPSADALRGIRPIGAVVLACAEAMTGRFLAARPTFEALGRRLAAAFEGLDAEWPWPEDKLTYENGLPARALIRFGVYGREERVLARGLAVLEWLDRVQTSPERCFSPIGNQGWWPRGGPRARWDQQPIEAGSMVLAAAEAYAATGDERFAQAAERAFGWFLGANDIGRPVADLERGGCGDGLGPEGPSANEGAESTLMWLMAVEAMRQLRQQ
jgi:hypothetical protein